jgi:hypothetical protein
MIASGGIEAFLLAKCFVGALVNQVHAQVEDGRRLTGTAATLQPRRTITV